jgi:hypothetical protein
LSKAEWDVGGLPREPESICLDVIDVHWMQIVKFSELGALNAVHGKII